MKTLTLCDSCLELLQSAYSVRRLAVTSISPKPAKTCDKCGKRFRDLRLYIVDRKGMDPLK